MKTEELTRGLDPVKVCQQIIRHEGLSEVDNACIRTVLADRDSLQRKVERYEKALEHYADESNWGDVPTVYRHGQRNLVEGYFVAAAALARTDDKKEE